MSSARRPCPPKIVEISRSVKVITGETVYLFCRATGNPPPVVTFQWNGVDLASVSSTTQGGGNGDLMIPSTDSSLNKFGEENEGESNTEEGWTPLGRQQATGQCLLRLRPRVEHTRGRLFCLVRNAIGQTREEIEITVYGQNDCKQNWNKELSIHCVHLLNLHPYTL
ncbi:unnamed protein product [Protopolystoma xenopodis]|uniref:Ig-like domain-containing protein n=1 Tax=Protopolystoma xenopodis TaxID=117903 RepID=A0A3S5A0N8_9PLAT|nr:unnamed protein product [Protopolystoma xenopodis]